MSALTRQALLGPTLVGLLLGLLVGFAVFGFRLEYGPHTHPDEQPIWLFALLDAALSFVVVLGGTVMTFGFVPLCLRKASST